MNDAMIADFLARGGEIRRYPQGFASDWLYLRNLMAGFGYEIRTRGRRYTFRPVGARVAPKWIGRAEFLRRVDVVLVENGRQPLVGRAAA